MTRLLVLGTGRVGSAIARDLSLDADLHVAVADRSRGALERLAEEGLTTHVVDLADADALRAVVGGFDLVVGALPAR